MTIRARLTLRFFLLVLAIIVVSSVVIYVFSERHRQEDFYSRLRNKAEGTVRLLLAVDEVNSSLLKRIEEDNPLSLPEEGIVIWNDSNKVMFDSDLKGHIQHDEKLLETIRAENELRWEKGPFEIIGFTFLEGNQKLVVIAASNDIYGKGRVTDLKWVMFSVFGFSLGFIILAGWIYAGRALLPISIIIDRVKQISISSLNLRLDEGNGSDELSQLAQTFNSMLERLEGGVKIQKDFIANASHEMRTPLTAITGQLEVALMSKRTNEKYLEVLQSVLEDIKNLNRTSNRLLLLAQANTEKVQIDKEEIRIDELLWQCQEELNKLHPEFSVNIQINLDFENEENLILTGNAQLLKTAISNLMENGCKYSSNKKILVTLSAEKQNLILKFEDKGIGIPETDLPHIFQPFFRASNSSASRGHGIGLSLVQRIAQIHKGKIEVRSKVGEGSVFSLTLPQKL
jgi:signal transduction histidine kinase